MDCRRSVRSKKAIDYSKFSNGGSDFEDEDFKTSSPPNKKLKQKKKDISSQPEAETKASSKLSRTRNNKESNNKIQNDDFNGKNDNATEKTRLPLAEKIFQRQLQTAVELSRKTQPVADEENAKETTSVKPDTEEIKETVSKGNEVLMHEVDNDKHKNLEVIEECGDGEENEETSSEESNENSTSDAENSAESSEESYSPVKKAKKVQGKLKSACSEKPNRSKEPIKQERKTVRPSAAKPASSRAQLISSSKYQGTSLTVQDLIKPANLPSLGLRLGLSRKAVVKPLHPTLKIHP